jgi:hypothetical protein
MPQEVEIRRLEDRERDNLKGQGLGYCFWELGPELQEAISDEAESVGLAIWNLRKAGTDQYAIARKLRLPLSLVEETLKKFEQHVAFEAGRAMQHFQILDSERIEELITRWMPAACPEGELKVDDDFEHSLKAAYLILTAIGQRLKILEVGQPQAGKDGQGQTNIALLVQQLFQQATGGPADATKTLVLESEAEKLD